MSAPGPWSPDRALDAAGAARAIREALPDLPVGDVRLLGRGWDFDAYEVDAQWVFRFPLRVQEQARLHKELALLAWLRHAIDIPMPRYAWSALEAPSFPYVFSGYPKLAGREATTVAPDSVNLGRIGRQLGAWLRTLHDLEPPEALRATLTEAVDAVTPRQARDGKTRYIHTFAEHVGGALADRAVRFLEDDTLLVPHATPTPRILHDDLHVGHLLLAPDDPGCVVGWLDWGDACMGDPARDFAPMYGWGGDALLDAMLAAYGHDDPDFRARARFHGICLAFTDWMHYHRTGDAAGVAWNMHALDAALP